ncbi:hypothetical protein Dip510_000065 [Elusimicrobium posterum]|uniref:hypothetical protein n=1 Tax=Elusimicrobium posterum TaxID=3116653 RepID=UPI003C71F229
MKDIIEIKNGDIILSNTEIPKAKNLFEVQEGDLYYFDSWGIDLDYFLNPDYQIQNASFNSYLLQKLGEWGLNVTGFMNKDGQFAQDLNFTFGDSQKETMMRG